MNIESEVPLLVIKWSNRQVFRPNESCRYRTIFSNDFLKYYTLSYLFKLQIQNIHKNNLLKTPSC